jgi:hypothetical protein
MLILQLKKDELTERTKFKYFGYCILFLTLVIIVSYLVLALVTLFTQCKGFFGSEKRNRSTKDENDNFHLKMRSAK